MLRILKTESDGHTGHIVVQCQIVEQNGNLTTTGLQETHGMHPSKLTEQYNGDVKEWLKYVHRGMKQRHEDRKAAVVAMESLRNIETIEDEE